MWFWNSQEKNRIIKTILEGSCADGIDSAFICGLRRSLKKLKACELSDLMLLVKLKQCRAIQDGLMEGRSEIIREIKLANPHPTAKRLG